MTELDDIDGLAAEYALGTLSHEERQAATAARARDSKLDQAIKEWEDRLGPLSEVVPPVEPSPGLYNKIRNQIGLSSNVVSFQKQKVALERKANLWRTATVGVSAFAASLALVVGWDRFATPFPTQYVAVLQHENSVSPAFLMTVDTQRDKLIISAVNAPKKQGKDYQVWLVHNDMPQPKSLGCYKDGQMTVKSVSSKDEAMLMDATFAVSMEPEGGSPTGTPSGPVVFSGRLIKATP